MRKALLFMLLSTLGGCVISIPAALADANVGRVPTVTRLVGIFSELEKNLAEAVARRDTKAVGKLLGKDFEMRVGDRPGNPIPRATWIQHSIAEPKSSSTLEQMAVHDYGRLTVVSFLWKLQETKSSSERDIFVIDIWMQGEDEWKLAVRYAAQTGTADSPIPGAVTVAPAFEKKE